MISNLESFLDTHIDNFQSKRYLLTVSGGIDSVVMCHLFKSLKLNFGIAHCNFQLRKNDSSQDELFVKKLATELETPFHTIQFDTLAYSKNNKKSIQLAARELRYEWFEEVKQEHLYDYICTAHHKDDVAETILYNLSNGTGLRGLHGIQALQNSLLRPLLFTNKSEVLTYATDQKIEWREDQSNKNDHYRRNYIRNQIIPLLKDINPQLIENIFETSQKIQAVEKIVTKSIENSGLLRQEEKQHVILINELKTVESPLFTLSELLKEFNFTYRNTNEIIKAIDNQSGTKFLSPTHQLYLDRGQLLISKQTVKNDFENIFIQKDDKSFTTSNKHFSISNNSINNFSLDINSSNACLDFDKLDFPLIVRKWQQTDRFKPLGMKGFKKVSDFLIDEKVSLIKKDDIFVLTSKEEICWVIGMRVDERFKLSKKTQQVFYVNELTK